MSANVNGFSVSILAEFANGSRPRQHRELGEPYVNSPPLVSCPHCDSQALKGAGLAAHKRREHGWLMAR